MLAEWADQPLQGRPIEPARPQQARCFPAEVEDAALHPDRAGATVKDEVDRAPRSAATWAAVVGLTRPEGLALGAARGSSTASSSARATG